MSNLDYFDIDAPIGRRKTLLGEDEDLDKAISRLTKEMKEAAKNLDFEKAAEIRDKLRELKEGSDFRRASRATAVSSFSPVRGVNNTSAALHHKIP